MADINLIKKDTQPPKKPREISISDVIVESRINHNELIDALNLINDTLRANSLAIQEINKKLSAHPNSDLAAAVEFNSQTLKDMSDKVLPAVKAQIQSNVNKVKNDLQLTLDDHEEKMVLAEGHSRRLNLIINGIVEGENEVTKDVVQDFMMSKLHMDEAVVKNFLFRDVHRLAKGKKPDGSASDLPRPIIMAFIRQQDRNSVLRQASELKGSNISLKSDLPRALNNLRSEMLKERKRLIALNPNVKYRVAEVSYRPCLQKSDGVYRAADGTERIRWAKINFPSV